MHILHGIREGLLVDLRVLRADAVTEGVVMAQIRDSLCNSNRWHRSSDILHRSA